MSSLTQMSVLDFKYAGSEPILTVDILKEKCFPGEILAQGKEEKIAINGISSCTKWVAVRGIGYWDWAIYYSNNKYEDWGDIRTTGTKLWDKSLIRRLVLCDDDAFALYRY
jgi:hypothetical protein